MKRLLMGLMLLVTAGAASAEWTRIMENNEYTLYADKETIRRSGNFVKIWILGDFKTIQTGPDVSSKSSKEQWELDCQEERIRRLLGSRFSGPMGGEKLVSTIDDPGKWDPMAPASVGETVWKIACGKK